MQNRANANMQMKKIAPKSIRKIGSEAGTKASGKKMMQIHTATAVQNAAHKNEMNPKEINLYSQFMSYHPFIYPTYVTMQSITNPATTSWHTLSPNGSLKCAIMILSLDRM